MRFTFGSRLDRFWSTSGSHRDHYKIEFGLQDRLRAGEWLPMHLMAHWLCIGNNSDGRLNVVAVLTIGQSKAASEWKRIIRSIR